MSEIFYPDQISTGYVMTEIASKLSDRVHLNVICGPAHFESDVYKSGKALKEHITINRVTIPNFNKNKIHGRILRMIFLSVKISFQVLKHVKSHDKVFLVTNPPLLLLMIGMLKWFKKFQYTLIVHDVFPENAVSAGLLGRRSLFYRISKWFFDKAYHAADNLIVVGTDMQTLISKKTNKPVSVITNWADSDEIYPDKTLSLEFDGSHLLENKIVIQFAGNIGRVQALKEFVEIFVRANNPNLALLIIGEGAFKQELREYVKTSDISGVVMLDALPRSMQNTFLNSCDIGLVTLSAGMFGLGVPSKSYNILSAGKPILFLGDEDSEICNYIRSDNVGWAFNWRNDNQLVEFLSNLKPEDRLIIEEKGLNARRMVDRKFTKTYILERYMNKLIDEL